MPASRKAVFARLRKAARTWPEGLAPQAFLALYANDISGTTLFLGQGKELDLKTRVQYSGSLIGPPYLVLVVVGEHNPRDGYAALVPMAIGVTLYGIAYALVHDGFIHRRIDPFGNCSNAYLDHVAASHRIHHLYNGAPYGMLAPVVSAELREKAARTQRDPFAEVQSTTNSPVPGPV